MGLAFEYEISKALVAPGESIEVEGLGDYLPKYAGNLDIMTAAAARTAEMFAEEMIAGRLTLKPTVAA